MLLCHSGTDRIEIGRILSGERPWVHFIGIGGVSMSSLAELCLKRGFKVTGSDSQRSERVSRLRSLGVSVSVPHREALPKAPRPDLAVYSLSIDSENPEYTFSIKNNIPTVSRAELMGYIISGFDCSLGVCGSHGKSTATAMLSSIFAEAGWDPTVLCGADLGDGSCYRAGSTRLIIYESCEYRDSFLCFSPTASLVLNIDFDHADYFKSISDLQSSFLRSADLTSDLLVYSSDDDNSACLRDVPGDKTVRTFGAGREADYRYSIFGYTTEGTEFTVTDKGGSTRLFLPLFGEHFVADAAGAYAIARELGVSASHCAHAISKFRGIPRRLEKLGCIAGYDVYYDYAHHPKEIRAAKEALALMGYGSVCAVFCPHTYSRTAALWSDFVFQLSELSLVYVTDIYAAREASIAGVESEALVKEINAHGGNSFYLSEGMDPELPVAVGKSALVLMGAGDLEKIKEKILNLGLT